MSALQPPTIRLTGALLATCFLSLAACRPAGRGPIQAVHGPPTPAALHALLLNGGGKPRINYQSHLLNLTGFVELLDNAGVPRQNIVIFSGDGSDPGLDLATRETNSTADFWLLPRFTAGRWLRPPIDYVNSTVDGYVLRPARQQALRNWFAEEGSALRPGDTLFLYVTDHGEINKDDLADNTITLWRESLSVTELRELLASVDPAVRIVMFMSQCFSGSFAHAMLPAGNVCGYFASSADRPAYGCYPENLGVDGVGHSHHFLAAIPVLGALPQAQRRVLVTDDSPDVPHTTSDFYLGEVLEEAAAEGGGKLRQVADKFIAQAWQRRPEWEPEIRLLDRIGQTFGMFSPRSLAELERQTELLPQVSKRLDTYAARWKEALESATQANFERFLAAHPEWKKKLARKNLKVLTAAERQALARAALEELVPFTAADEETHARLFSLRQRADDAATARYRMEVRLGGVLRMRALLTSIAGRTYLAERGTEAQRATFAKLTACENLDLLPSAPVESAAALEPPTPFPTLADDERLLEAIMPAWMGIRYRPLEEEARQRRNLSAGAVAVLTVFPDSAAERAGLRAGDVILGPPGTYFEEPNEVREWTMRSEIGTPAPLSIVRDNEPLQISLRPQPFPMKLPKLPGPPKIGSMAPAVKVEPFRGEVVAEASRPRLLFFWATWCAPCKFALPEVMAFGAEHRVEVVAITDEDTDTLRDFFDKFSDPFPAVVATDPYRITFQAFGVSGTPTFVLIDAQGKVRHYRTGYDAQLGLGIKDWQRKPRRKRT